MGLLFAVLWRMRRKDTITHKDTVSHTTTHTITNTHNNPTSPPPTTTHDPHTRRPQSPAANLLAGAFSGLLAASACYPLDTVRRRMQLPGHPYRGQLHALAAIWAAEGARGLYGGWAANAAKVVPQNAARLAAYEALKQLLGVARAATDT